MMGQTPSTLINRKKVLEKSGKAFLRSVSTSDGWMRTVFVLKVNARRFSQFTQFTQFTQSPLIVRKIHSHIEAFIHGTNSHFDFFCRKEH